MDLQDPLAPLEVRSVHDDLAVEASGPQQGGIEDVGPVGRGHQDHRGALIEPVHLDEELVERLLAFVVPAAEAGAAVATDGVDLVDEHDRGRALLRLLEQVPDPGGPDADEHLDEIRTRDRVEGDAGLPRHGPREQRLARARRPEQQDAPRDLGAHRLELGRVGQVLLDLLQLLDRLVDARDVGERGLRLVLRDELRARLTELHHAPAAALGLVHDEDERADDQDHGDQLEQEPDQRRSLLRVGRDVHTVLLEIRGERFLGSLDVGDAVRGPVGELTFDHAVPQQEVRRGDVAGGDLALELAERELLGGRAAVGEQQEEPDGREDDQDVDRRTTDEPPVRRPGVGSQGVLLSKPADRETLRGPRVSRRPSPARW